ncbi:hypothetical protein AURDEDRAFT_183107 [Auricularia subglabra TFB-10046 SS5]|nr:hypothetical protein AURDEDRAFT_183107 [Auricularia subglabra TFB-10046 SS5]
MDGVFQQSPILDISFSDIMGTIATAMRREQESNGPQYNVEVALNNIVETTLALINDATAFAATLDPYEVTLALGSSESSDPTNTSERKPSEPQPPLLMHGKLPATLYHSVLLNLADDPDTIRACRTVDRIFQMEVDAEPAFWNPVVLKARNAVNHVGFFVDRAGQAPVQVTIYLSRHEHYADGADAPLGQLALRMGRIGSLTISANMVIPAVTLRPLLTAQAPYLQSLELNCVVVGHVRDLWKLATLPSLRSLTAPASILRAIGTTALHALRGGITHVRVAAVDDMKISLDDLILMFPHMHSLALASRNLIEHHDPMEAGRFRGPRELEISESGDAPPTTRALRSINAYEMRRVVVRRAGARTLAVLRGQFNTAAVYRLALFPDLVAFWAGLERARVFPDVGSAIVASFVLRQVPTPHITSLVVAQFLPAEVYRVVSRALFVGLRVLTVRLGVKAPVARAGSDSDFVDILTEHRGDTWRCPGLVKLVLSSRAVPDVDEVPSASEIPTISAANLVPLVNQTIGCVAVREIEFDWVELCEGRQGAHIKQLGDLAKIITYNS